MQRIAPPPVGLERRAERRVAPGAGGIHRHHADPNLEAARRRLHQIRHAHRRSPCPGLQDRNPGDPSGHRLVRVPRYDQAHAATAELLGEADDLARAGHRVARAARVREQDRRGRAARRHLAEDVVQRQLPFAEAESPRAVRGQTPLRVGRNVADHGDRDAAGLDHAPGHEPVRPPSGGAVLHVRRQPGIPRLAQPLLEHVGRPVEVVVAERRRRVAEPAEQLHAGPAPRLVLERRALHRVARVEPELGAATRFGQAVERGRQRRGAGEQRAVQVAGGEHAEHHRVARGRGKRLDRHAEEAAHRPVGDLGHDAPARPGVLRGIDRTPRADGLDQKLGNALALVVHHRSAAQHGVPAGPRLAIAVDRHGEAVARLHRPAAHAQPLDPLADRLAEVDLVLSRRPPCRSCSPGSSR